MLLLLLLLLTVPTGLPSSVADIAVYVFVFDINQPSLPTPFDSVLVSVSVFKALSTVFHSINSPDNSSSLISVLLLFSTVYIFMVVSFNPDTILCG